MSAPLPAVHCADCHGAGGVFFSRRSVVVVAMELGCLVTQRCYDVVTSIRVSRISASRHRVEAMFVVVYYHCVLAVFAAGVISASSQVYVLVCFAAVIVASRSVALPLLYLACYFWSAICIFFLEGGQAARFLCHHLSVVEIQKLPRCARSLIETDQQDDSDLRVYMGTRQFLTLFTTTVNGLAVLWVAETLVENADAGSYPSLLTNKLALMR